MTKPVGTRSLVLHDHPRVVEGVWSHSPTRTAFSAAQRMGVCRHLLQRDRRGCVPRGGWRLLYLRVSRPRQSLPCCSRGGIVGASTAQPCPRSPLSRQDGRTGKRPLRIEQDTMTIMLRLLHSPGE